MSTQKYKSEIAMNFNMLNQIKVLNTRLKSFFRFANQESPR